MNETTTHDFVGYEYRDIAVRRDMQNLYADGYQNFGWSLENVAALPAGIYSTSMKFKRNRKIRNKAELTRLQRQFDGCVSEIVRMEKSKAAGASIVAYTIGLVGTALLACSTFAFLADMIPLCVVLAIPGFIGWVLPYFSYHATFAKKGEALAPLIDGKYEGIYQLCEKANGLLGA